MKCVSKVSEETADYLALGWHNVVSAVSGGVFHSAEVERAARVKPGAVASTSWCVVCCAGDEVADVVAVGCGLQADPSHTGGGVVTAVVVWLVCCGECVHWFSPMRCAAASQAGQGWRVV